MTLRRAILQLLASSLIYSGIITLVDFAIIFAWQRELIQVMYTLSLILLFEGGLSLVVGGAIASFSSTFGKVKETVFHSEPWNAKQLKAAEGTARIWIMTGLLLFLFGLAVSLLQ